MTWSSSDDNVATVVSTGDFTAEVTGVTDGTAVITETTEDGGHTDDYTVTVIPVEGVFVNKFCDNNFNGKYRAAFSNG